MNFFVLFPVFFTPCLFGDKIQKRERRDEICRCEDSFQKVPGVPFKCLSVENWRGNAAKGKEHCEKKNAILFEPESRAEVDTVVDFSTELKGKRFPLGYARKPGSIACSGATGTNFYSVSNCELIPDAMGVKGGDNGASKEFCLEMWGGKRLNDLPCNLYRNGHVVCQFYQECPSAFEKVEGIHDKCFKVASSKGRGKVSQAKKYCDDRSGYLYEPKSQNEMEKLDSHFPQLKKKRYFVGYTKTSSEFACPDKTSDVFHGISECSDIPGAMWLDGEPDASKECVQSINENNVRGLVSKACDDDDQVDYVVCQFNKYCGNYTEPENIESDDQSDVTDEEESDVTEYGESDVTDDDNSDVTDDKNNDVTDDENNDDTDNENSDETVDEESDVTDDEESDVTDDEESDVTDHEEGEVDDDDKGKESEGDKLLHIGVEVSKVGSGSFSINHDGTHSAEIKPAGH